MSDVRWDVLAAIGEDDAARLRALMTADPTLAALRDDAGVSVLMLARYRQQPELVEAIRAAGPALDVFEAAALGEADVLATILAADAGASGSWSADGFTALHFAAFFGDVTVAQLLLTTGADPDAVSRNAMAVRPLHSAVAGGRAGVALALVAAGADVNATQRHGWTPLHGAAQQGLVDVVEALLAAGANPRATNDDGVDAAALAEQRRDIALAARLRGAST